eukprot:1049788-Pelagomonas_calceolata.AAC.1
MEAGCLQCSSSCQFVVNTSRICLSERSDCKSRAASRKRDAQGASRGPRRDVRARNRDQGEGPSSRIKQRDQAERPSRGRITQGLEHITLSATNTHAPDQCAHGGMSSSAMPTSALPDSSSTCFIQHKQLSEFAYKNCSNACQSLKCEGTANESIKHMVRDCRRPECHQGTKPGHK